jgi:hypothetical protein
VIGMSVKVMRIATGEETEELKTAKTRSAAELRALACQDLQAGPAPGQVMDEIDQVA